MGSPCPGFGASMKTSMKKSVLIAAVAGLLVAGGIILALGKTGHRPDVVATQETQAVATPEAAVEPAANAESAEAAPESAAIINYDSASLPTEPMGARTLGDPNAPIKLQEFASLTCSHCAEFHKDTFPALKAKYIDTGKVFFTFNDFPLNQPALDASMVARCLQPDRYFPFVSMLFQSQGQWAFGGKHVDALRQNAKLAGMSDERFDSCLADQKMKEAIATRMKEAGEKYKIDSTPSFVFNEGAQNLRGSVPIAAFDQVITAIESGVAPAAEPAASEVTPTAEPAPAPQPPGAPMDTAPEPAPETPSTTEAPKE